MRLFLQGKSSIGSPVNTLIMNFRHYVTQEGNFVPLAGWLNAFTKTE